MGHIEYGIEQGIGPAAICAEIPLEAVVMLLVRSRGHQQSGLAQPSNDRRIIVAVQGSVEILREGCAQQKPVHGPYGLAGGGRKRAPQVDEQ